MFRFEGFEGFLSSYLFSGYFIRDIDDLRRTDPVRHFWATASPTPK
ncbi:MAG: hypothetical protein R2724_30960 [Bryobacterales bacterium]